ncbi:MAG: AEC family transporter, partial [Pseudomonadota bacterium]
RGRRGVRTNVLTGARAPPEKRPHAIYASFFDALQFAILPIFAFLVIGFAMGLRGAFTRAAAEGTNAYVVGVAVPCLLFYMLARIDLDDIDWPVMAVYLGSNVVLYALGYALAHYGFGLRRREALLLGMTGAFPNHVFFILPIVERLYGAEATLPISAMIVFDVVVLFAGTVLLLEAVTGRSNPVTALKNIAQNRLLIAIGLGIAFNQSGLALHSGVERFLELAGASAAPASLFALGVVLSGGDLSRIGGPAWGATALKIVLHPLIAIVLFGSLVPVSPEWAPISLIVFAAPCGAMAFVLGLRYDTPVDNVAKAIIVSTVLSVFAVAILA